MGDEKAESVREEQDPWAFLENLTEEDGFSNWMELLPQMKADEIIHGLDQQELELIGANRHQVEDKLARGGCQRSWYGLSSMEKFWYGIMNVPVNDACERLKNEVPEDVFEMLVKRQMREPMCLSQRDRNGNTPLMRLVKALKAHKYILPCLPVMVAFMKTDDLTHMNNANEDSLYLSCLYCPSMPYVAGFIASVYVERDIDINQRIVTLSNVQLLNAIVEQGDTHVDVLKQLLRLKNKSDATIINPSQPAQNGVTPLYQAVKSHQTLKPDGQRRSTIETVRTLLEFGADALIQHPRHGYTPLHMAVAVNPDHRLVRELLVGAGAGALQIQNKYTYTPEGLLEFLGNNEEKQALLNLFQECRQQRQNEGNSKV